MLKASCGNAATQPTPKRQQAAALHILARPAILAVAILAQCASGAVTPTPGPALVDLTTVAPTVRLDLRYATPNNFTGRALYPVARCLLRPAVAARLARVQSALASRHLGLKVYDCYRPLSVQRLMWTLVPDERYVADPAKGSRHNRGAAVDVTLVRADGEELAMPTPFDDFSERARVDYVPLPAEVGANRALLQRAMRDAGFEPLPTEWWHFDAPDWQSFDVLDVPLTPSQNQ
jgi:D-alanyl-D-alanine dipeptidase